jgi:hypothetical protein
MKIGITYQLRIEKKSVSLQTHRRMPHVFKAFDIHDACSGNAAAAETFGGNGAGLRIGACWPGSINARRDRRVFVHPAVPKHCRRDR